MPISIRRKLSNCVKTQILIFWIQANDCIINNSSLQRKSAFYQICRLGLPHSGIDYTRNIYQRIFQKINESNFLCIAYIAMSLAPPLLDLVYSHFHKISHRFNHNRLDNTGLFWEDQQFNNVSDSIILFLVVQCLFTDYGMGFQFIETANIALIAQTPCHDWPFIFLICMVGMSIERPRIMLTIDRELQNRIEDFDFENR